MSKHLTLTDRALIEKYLAQGYSLSEIAVRLSRHVSTISREIQSYRNFLYYDNTRGHCVNYDSCRKHHIMTEGECHYCREFCKQCIRYDCSQHCSEFVSSKCNKLSKPPYVCTNCEEKSKCRYLFHILVVSVFTILSLRNISAVKGGCENAKTHLPFP